MYHYGLDRAHLLLNILSRISGWYCNTFNMRCLNAQNKAVSIARLHLN